MAKAVVIGGGGIGVSCAYFLERAGFDVTLVDRAQLGHACSYGNACLIVPSHSDPIPSPGVVGQALAWMLRKDSPFYIRPRIDFDLLRFLLRFRRYCNAEAAERGFDALLSLSRKSLALYQELVESGEATFFFAQKGLLEVFLTEAGFAHARASREMLAKHGFRSSLLTPEEAVALEPAVAPDIVGGLFIEGEAHGYSYGYVRALADKAADRGVRFETGRAVSSIDVVGGRVKGVTLQQPRERVPADCVVLAAGSWSRALAAPLGIEIPLQPAKGYSATIDTYEGAPEIPVLVKERKVIVTPLESRLRFGGTLELTGFDETIHGPRYEAVLAAGRRVLRQTPPRKGEEPWSGLRPVTPDGLPIIDRSRDVSGLIVATGHGMLGFTQSPVTGKLVSEMARGEPPSVPLEPFRLDRF